MKLNRDNYEAYILDYLEDNLSQEERAAVELFLLENPDLDVDLESDLPKLEFEDINKISFSGLKKDLVWDEEEVGVLLLNEIEEEIESHDIERLIQFEESFPEQFKNVKKLLLHTVLKPVEHVLPELDKLSLFKEATEDECTRLIAYVEGDLSADDKLALDKEVSEDVELGKELALFQATKLEALPHALPSNFKSSLKRKVGVVIPLWAKSLAAVAAVLLAFFIPFSSDSEDNLAEFTPRNSNYIQSVNESNNSDELAFIRVSEKLYPVDSKESNFHSTQNLKNIFNGTQNAVGTELAAIEPRVSLIQSGMQFNNEFLYSEPLALTPIVTDYSSYYDFEYNEPLAYEEPEALTPAEIIIKKFEESAVDNDPNNVAAIALVNKAAKNITDSDSDFIVLENNRKRDKGFKFSIGKLSIESTR